MRVTVGAIAGLLGAIAGLLGAIAGLLGAGHSVDEILREYPYLEKDDIQAALAYAAWRSDEIELPAQGIMTIRLTRGSTWPPFRYAS